VSEPVAGLTRVALPIGVNAVESVNMHVLADGDRVTLVDCGVWRPDLPDGGMGGVEAGLAAGGYALRDVSRIVSATPSGGSRPSSATSCAVWSRSAARSRSGPRP
jgi:hypothetical protein